MNTGLTFRAIHPKCGCEVEWISQQGHPDFPMPCPEHESE